MAKPISAFLARCRVLRHGVIALVSACIASLAAAQSSTALPPPAITAITLERQCFGCASASILVVRRDGTATLTVPGNARQGTEDKVSTGTLRAQDFDALVRLVVAQGFFELSDAYEDPQIRDGTSTTVTVTRGGQDKRVFRREDAGPAAAKAVEAAIEALKARVDFVPARR